MSEVPSLLRTVGPKRPPQSQIDYWKAVEPLCRYYLRETGHSPGSFHMSALQYFCGFPPFAHRHLPAWKDWNHRWDADTLGRLRGRDLLQSIGPFVGVTPREMVEAISSFVRWLGARGAMDERDAGRLAAELEHTLPAFARRIEREIDAVHDQEAPELAVAPFLEWLLDTTTLPLEHRLFGQRLAMTALRMSDAQEFEDAHWASFDIAGCIASSQTDACPVDLGPAEQVRVATALLSFLQGRGLITHHQKARLGREARSAVHRSGLH